MNMELRQADDAEEDEWPRAKSSKLPQCAAAFAVTLMSFCGGVCVELLSYTASAFINTTDLTEYQIKWFLFLPYLSAILGAPFVGLLLQRRGRRMTHLLLGILFAVSYSMLLALKTSLWGLAGAQLLAGLSMGGVLVTSPAYLGEITEDSVRGRLACLHQVMFSGGILFIELPRLTHSYVIVCASCLVVPVLAMAVFCWMPETPYYHLLQNRKQEAKSSLQRLRGRRCCIDKELHSMQAYVDDVLQQGSAFRDRAVFKAFAICLILVTFQWLISYNNLISFPGIYSVLLEFMLPLRVMAIIPPTLMFVGSFVGLLLADWLGRRILLITSSLVMVASLVVLGIFYIIKEHPDALLLCPWAALASWFSFIIASSICKTLVWTMVAELMPLNVKGIGGSLNSSLYWLLAILWSICYRTMENYVEGPYSPWVFSFICLIEALFVYFFVPETKCKPLHQIQDDLSKRSKGRVINVRVEQGNAGTEITPLNVVTKV